MPYGLYVYTSDAGIDYAVGVPADFAVALSMVPATTQPGLDPTIQPRYAACKSAGGLIRTAIVQTRTIWSALPGTSITVGGVTYDWTSFAGESVPPLQSTFIQAPMGPQGLQGLTGAQGPPGLTLVDSLPQTADVNVTTGTAGDLTVNSIPLAAGNYFVILQANIYNVSGGGICWRLLVENASLVITLLEAAGGFPNDTQQWINTSGMVTVGAGHVIKAVLFSCTGSFKAAYQDDIGQPVAVGLQIFQLP